MLCAVETEKNNGLSFLPLCLAGSSVFWPLTPAAVGHSWLGRAVVVLEPTEDAKTICSFILVLTWNPGQFDSGKLSMVGRNLVVFPQRCQTLCRPNHQQSALADAHLSEGPKSYFRQGLERSMKNGQGEFCFLLV